MHAIRTIETLLLGAALAAIAADFTLASERSQVPTLADPAKAAQDQKETQKAEAAKTEEKKQEAAKEEQKKEAAAQEAAKATDAKPAETAKATDAAKAAEVKKPAAADIHKVKRAPFKVQLELDGVFEAKQMSEVALRPEMWTMLTVRSAVEQGSAVKKDDVLVSCDLTKINEEIRDLDVASKLAQLSIAQLENEIRTFEPLMPLDLAVAERAKRIADTDLAEFLKKDRNLTARQADLGVKIANLYVSYGEDELKQLEKMYKADDLTEETEEIILRRQRDDLELAKYMRENATISRDQTLSIELPRQEESLRESVTRQKLALEKAQSTLPMNLNRMRTDLERQRHEETKSRERLAKLRTDLAAMTIKAPAGGIVYYGPCVRGHWPQAASVAERLRRGGNISPHEVFMTIVEPRPVLVRAVVPERELYQVQPGVTGHVAAVGFPKQRHVTTVYQVTTYPEPNGQFTAALSVDLPPQGTPVPGMDCKVKLVTYTQASAIAVPSKGVFTDDFDDQKQYVYVLDAAGKSTRRDVTVGRQSGENSEITGGLSEGESILLKKPDPES